MHFDWLFVLLAGESYLFRSNKKNKKNKKNNLIKHAHSRLGYGIFPCLLFKQ